MRLFLILMTVASSACAGDFEIEDAIVTEVIDGDTIKVVYEDGSIDNIRLIGINAPEDPRTGGKGVKDPIGGPLATEYLKELIEGVPVLLETDPARNSGDCLLAYVYIRVNEEPGKKSLVNLLMVKDGFAIADPEKATGDYWDEVFIKAEEVARAGECGLWGAEKVYLTTTRGVYHLAGCHHLNNLKEPEGISRLEALKESINPCKDCGEQ